MSLGPGAPQSGGARRSADADTSASFEDRALVTALRRVALARSQLEALTEAVRATLPAPEFDHAALRELELVHDDLVHARDRARSRFGGHARHRVAELEARHDELLGRLGAGTLVEAQALEAHPPPSPGFDPSVVDFARRELAEASRALDELLAAQRSSVEADREPAAADAGPAGDVVDLRAVPSTG